MAEPAAIAAAVNAVPGVIEHVFFVDMAHLAIQVGPVGSAIQGTFFLVTARYTYPKQGE